MTARAFVRRPFNPLRVLWYSRMWIALALLVLAWLLTFVAEGTPLYAKVILWGGGTIMAALRWRDTASMWRAARGGEVRQAVVTGLESTRWYSNGVFLCRLTWQDAVGARGHWGPVRFDTLPGKGTRIIVYADPLTGRTWWEDRL